MIVYYNLTLVQWLWFLFASLLPWHHSLGFNPDSRYNSFICCAWLADVPGATCLLEAGKLLPIGGVMRMHMYLRGIMGTCMLSTARQHISKSACLIYLFKEIDTFRSKVFDIIFWIFLEDHTAILFNQMIWRFWPFTALIFLNVQTWSSWPS